MVRPSLRHVVAALVLLMSPTAWADYRAGRGDVLELGRRRETRSCATARRSIPTAKIALPLGGRCAVNGMTAEVRSKVRQNSRARSSAAVMSSAGNIRHPKRRRDQVVIAEYRPVYLNGDVSKPGEQVYTRASPCVRRSRLPAVTTSCASG